MSVATIRPFPSRFVQVFPFSLNGRLLLHVCVLAAMVERLGPAVLGQKALKSCQRTGPACSSLRPRLAPPASSPGEADRREARRRLQALRPAEGGAPEGRLPPRPAVKRRAAAGARTRQDPRGETRPSQLRPPALDWSSLRACYAENTTSPGALPVTVRPRSLFRRGTGNSSGCPPSRRTTGPSTCARRTCSGPSGRRRGS